MNKLGIFLIVILSIAVGALGAALFLQRSPAPTSVSQSASSEEDPAKPVEGREESADAPSSTGAGDSAEEESAILQCTVQSGALKILRGETFGVAEGPADTCETSFEDGVYTVSASGSGQAVAVTVPESADFDQIVLTVTGGSLNVEDVDTRELSAACTKGALYYAGNVTEDASVEHTQGETTLQLDGSAADFNYALSYQMGHIQIGDQTYTGAGGEESVDNGSQKTLRVNCAMGSVDILFSDAA